MAKSTLDAHLSGIISACERFKKEAIEEAIKSSTQASYGGSGYSVELFPDGSYRVLQNNQFFNLYEAKGVIIGIPPCSNDDSPDDDNDEWFFGNAIKAFEEKFNHQVISAIKDA